MSLTPTIEQELDSARTGAAILQESFVQALTVVSVLEKERDEARAEVGALREELAAAGSRIGELLRGLQLIVEQREKFTGDHARIALQTLCDDRDAVRARRGATGG